MSIQLVCVLIVAALVLAAAAAAFRRYGRVRREAADRRIQPPQPEPAAAQAVEVSQESAAETAESEPDWIGAPSFEGQTVYVETLTDRFHLRLRDRENCVYDAIRLIKTNHGVAKDRFRMLFLGTLMTCSDTRHGSFVSGGRLRYRKAYGKFESGETLSSIVVRVLFASDRAYQQAS